MAIGTTAAVLGGATLLSGVLGNKSAKRAAQAQERGAQIAAEGTAQGLELQRDMFNQQIQELQQQRVLATGELKTNLQNQINKLEAGRADAESQLKQGFYQASDITRQGTEDVLGVIDQQRAESEAAQQLGFDTAEQAIAAGVAPEQLRAATQQLAGGFQQAGQQLGQGLGAVQSAQQDAGQQLGQGLGAVQQGTQVAQDVLGGSQAEQLYALASGREQALGLGQQTRDLGSQGLSRFADAALGDDVLQRKLNIDEERTNQSLAARGLLNSSAGLGQIAEGRQAIVDAEQEQQIQRQLQLAELGQGQIGAGQNILTGSAANEANILGGTAAQIAGLSERGGAAEANIYGQQANLAERGGAAEANIAAQQAALTTQGAQAQFGGETAAIQAERDKQQAQANLALQRGQAVSGLGQQFAGQEINALGAGSANQANIAQNQGQALGGLAQSSSQNIANVSGSLGSGLANIRTGTASQAAQATGQSAQAQSNLLAQRGDILGGGVAQSGAIRNQNTQDMLGSGLKLGTALLGTPKGQKFLGLG